MGTALYVSPEQATGQPLSGSSDVYSLGVVAYECLAGAPPFVSEQPVAIAIMHKQDPVPPLPGDVPRPVADLVYAMLAKNPEDRPASAKHVADRAEVIREARNRSGYSGPATSDLPVVPNFPPATSADIYQNDAQRMPPPRGGGSGGSRTFLVAGIGAAAIGVVAIIAVLISSNGNNSAHIGQSTTAPPQTHSQSAAPKKDSSATVSQPVSTVGGGGPGIIVDPTTGKASPSKSPTPKKSATPTKSPTLTTSPPVTTTTTPPVTTSPTTTTTPPTTTSPPATGTATATATAANKTGTRG
jgi:serine/threonine-protein kinase